MSKEGCMDRRESTSEGDFSALAPQPGGLIHAFTIGADRLEVRAEVRSQGRDLLLLITGGQAHVGAVAVCGTGLDGQSAAELVEVPGHKEGPLAREAASELCRITGRTCVAVVGIHQEKATRREIVAIVANVRQLISGLEILQS